MRIWEPLSWSLAFTYLFVSHHFCNPCDEHFPQVSVEWSHRDTTASGEPCSLSPFFALKINFFLFSFISQIFFPMVNKIFRVWCDHNRLSRTQNEEWKRFSTQPLKHKNSVFLCLCVFMSRRLCLSLSFSPNIESGKKKFSCVGLDDEKDCKSFLLGKWSMSFFSHCLALNKMEIFSFVTVWNDHVAGI